MQKIKAQPLTAEAFAPYGSYVNLTQPTGAHIGDAPFRFYHDPLTMPFLVHPLLFLSVRSIDRRR